MGNCSSSPLEGCTDSQTLISLDSYTEMVTLKLGELVVKKGQIVTDITNCRNAINLLWHDVLEKLETYKDNRSDCCERLGDLLDDINDELDDKTNPDRIITYPCGVYNLTTNFEQTTFETRECGANSWEILTFSCMDCTFPRTVTMAGCQEIRMKQTAGVTFTLVQSCEVTTTTTSEGVDYPCGGYFVKNNTLDENLYFGYQCCYSPGCDIVTTINLLPGLSYQTSDCEPSPCCDKLWNVNPLLTVTKLWECDETTSTTTPHEEPPVYNHGLFSYDDDEDFVCDEDNVMTLYYQDIIEVGTVLFTDQGVTVFNLATYIKRVGIGAVVKYEVNNSGVIILQLPKYCE
jgi:ribosomal protein L37E